MDPVTLTAAYSTPQLLAMVGVPALASLAQGFFTNRANAEENEKKRQYDAAQAALQGQMQALQGQKAGENDALAALMNSYRSALL